MAYDKVNDLPDIQSDVLTSDLSGNTKISKFKQLKTNEKVVTKAINTLNDQLNNVTKSADQASQEVINMKTSNNDIVDAINSMKEILTDIQKNSPKDIVDAPDKDEVIYVRNQTGDGADGNFSDLPNRIRVTLSDGTERMIPVVKWTQNGTTGTSTSVYFKGGSNRFADNMEYTLGIPEGIYDTNSYKYQKRKVYISRLGGITTNSGYSVNTIYNICDQDFYPDTFTSLSLLTSGTNAKKICKAPALHTKYITNFSGMFISCTSLSTTGEITVGDTIKSVDMSNVFNNCTLLKDVGVVDTSKATNMNQMFNKCTALPSVFPWEIDCSSISTINGVKNMFAGSSVTEVTFKNVKEELKESFTADNIGSTLTTINLI